VINILRGQKERNISVWSMHVHSNDLEISWQTSRKLGPQNLCCEFRRIRANESFQNLCCEFRRIRYGRHSGTFSWGSSIATLIGSVHMVLAFQQEVSSQACLRLGTHSEIKFQVLFAFEQREPLDRFLRLLGRGPTEAHSLSIHFVTWQ